MTTNDAAPDTSPKADLLRYLQLARDALVWKLEGLDEYDIRRPLTPTGTNLLGIVKHVASVEAGYLGETFGRPFPRPLPWFDEGADPNADMWATADETREQLVGLYHEVWAHSDATVGALDLTATGRVPWWPAERADVTLHRILVHMIAETDRHAGHADIVRELVDESAGLNAERSNLPEVDGSWWRAYRQRVDDAARAAARPGP